MTKKVNSKPQEPVVTETVTDCEPTVWGVFAPSENDSDVTLQCVTVEEFQSEKERLNKFNKNSRERDINLGEKIDTESKEREIAISNLEEWCQANGNEIKQLYDGFNALSDKLTVVDVKFKQMHTDAAVPQRSTDGSAGLDFKAVSIDYDKSTHTKFVHTGWAVQIPEGYVGLMFPKNSIYRRTDRLTNAVGVIDSDYRGEMVAVFDETYRAYEDRKRRHRWWWPFVFSEPIENGYRKGDWFIQLVIVPCPKVRISFTEKLSETERGENGLGGMDHKLEETEMK